MQYSIQEYGSQADTSGQARSRISEAPTGAPQQSFKALSEAVYYAAHRVAARNNETLPELAEAFRERGIVVIGGQALGPLGYFANDKWRTDTRCFHEIHINVGHVSYASVSSVEQAKNVLDTIAHELVHFYAREHDIRDTSGRGRGHGRYHNRKFANLAVAVGLKVANSGKSHIGYATVGLSEIGLERYQDLIADLSDALRFTSVPELQPAPATSSTNTGSLPREAKYIFAYCACRDDRGRARTIRIARGWWEPGTIGCSRCRRTFEESLPQMAETTPTGTASTPLPLVALPTPPSISHFISKEFSA